MNRFKTVFELLKQAAADWMDDNAPRLGASLAYYTVFSISPLMLIVLAIAGFLFGQEAARRGVFNQINGLVGPDSAEAIQAVLAQAQKPHAGVVATTLAALTLLVGSTGVFVELQDALNTVWGVQPKASAGWARFVPLNQFAGRSAAGAGQWPCRSLRSWPGYG
jgi:membrane protein